MSSYTIIRYVLIAVVVVMLSALGGWYFFLKKESASIVEVDAGRGAGLSETFGAPTGSFYQNIVSNLSTFVGGVQNNDKRPAQLLQVGKTPTAGYGFVDLASTTRLRFVERGSGYVFDVTPETGLLERRANTLVPRTHEALITRSGRVVMRGLDERDVVTTAVGSISQSTSTPQTDAKLSLRRLPDGIESLVVNPAGEELLYILPEGVGATGVRASWDGTKELAVFSSAIRGWQIQWPSTENIVLMQNPTAGAVSSAYALQKDGTLSPVVQNVQGLTFLARPATSGNLSAFLYGSGFSLFARISSTSTPISLPIRTIADKCVWAPRLPSTVFCAVPQQLPPADFLDRWLRGEVHTTDAWWRVDVNANSAELLLAPTTRLDVEYPTIDRSGNYIAFTNAIDKSLWLLRVSE